jgi:IS5 family transposase
MNTKRTFQLWRKEDISTLGLHIGIQLKRLSSLLDGHQEILPVIARDLINKSLAPTGRTGLSVESIFRCLILKQLFGFSYEQLAFHLSDSMSYRTFFRLPSHLAPKKSCLQSTIRRLKPETLELVHQMLSIDWLEKEKISLQQLRIDSTVVASNIAPPSDSNMLDDGVRVLSRYLMKSRDITGIKIRFTDKRDASKSLAFQIFNAKKTVKDALYLDLLKLVDVVLKQAERGLRQVSTKSVSPDAPGWIKEVEHYRNLLLRVVSQTKRRVVDNEKVPAVDKIVSIFEEHTDIIIKGFRDTQFGHKINLSSERSGIITHLSIEKGNPADSDLFLQVLDSHREILGRLPQSVVCDGGYASKANVEKGRALGIDHVVFHKRVGISYLAMGVKRKTFERLRNFRAGIEGNISELKRTFGVSKATWKGHEGFQAFVWSSVISYNLVRLARLPSG